MIAWFGSPSVTVVGWMVEESREEKDTREV